MKTAQQKLKYNSLSSMLNQVITIACGLILPRLIIGHYGSEINGLVSSITQFLSIVTLLDLGIGAVVQAALYKPLVEEDNVRISQILKSSNLFFRKIAGILFIYTIILIFIYPILTKSKFEPVFSGSLILIIAISSFVQYFFGVTNQLLLNADQKVYVQTLLQSLVLILNTIVSFVLIKLDMSIHIVKLATALIFVIRPVLMQIYVERHYDIDRKIVLDGEPIQQKWNGLAQHFAGFVLNNTDVVVLTMFSSFESISIYTVYYNVVYGINRLLLSLMTGFQSMWGEMIARNEQRKLEHSFDYFEWLLHNAVTLLFSVTGILIIPFVRLYTANIADVQYIVPDFAYLITLAYAACCLRLPYNMIIYSAGKFKETQNSAWVEMMINIVVSVLLVQRFDISGVAIGTIAAMLYRTIYLAFYLRKDILYRNMRKFGRRIFQDIIIAGLIIFSSNFIHFDYNSPIRWIIYAIIVFTVALMIELLVNIILEPEKIKYTLTRK